MPLVKMQPLLDKATREHRACGAFNVNNMEMIIGILQAAEETNTPIILQLAETRLKYSPLDLIGPMMVQAARQARLDVAVHLDHGLTIETVKKALDFGFSSVMLDASALHFEENIRKTQEVVALARTYGATVESELGLVGGNEGNGDHEIHFTNQADAQEFVSRTGIDALAVAIGNAHGNYPVTPKLAFDVLEQIQARVSVPLVLHGGSGISDKDFQRSITLVIRKINIATASFNRILLRVGEYLKSGGKHDYFGLNRAMVAGTYENVKHHIDVFNEPFQP